jgi:hypothetical protein
MSDLFESDLTYKGNVSKIWPQFTGTRVMMLPLICGDMSTVPPMVGQYDRVLEKLFGWANAHTGKVVYLTVDEKAVKAGETHRRPGLHVDGVYRKVGGGWGGGDGGGGSWGGGTEDPKKSTGMLTVSSHLGCRAWWQVFRGAPDAEGSCEHLRAQASDYDAIPLLPYDVWWLDGLCVHESLPIYSHPPYRTADATRRAFLRLSLPSTAPWFEGYTENPLGVSPSGPILPRREFMNA